MSSNEQIASMVYSMLDLEVDLSGFERVTSENNVTIFDNDIYVITSPNLLVSIEIHLRVTYDELQDVKYFEILEVNSINLMGLNVEVSQSQREFIKDNLTTIFY